MAIRYRDWAHMDGAHRRVPSRSTVERICKAVGTVAKDAAPKIERYLCQSEGVPEGTVAISIGLDRTTVSHPTKLNQEIPQKPPGPHSPLTLVIANREGAQALSRAS